ncbi:hypothetical protein B0H16DRAFT_1607540, partial [Mycena metata]
MRDQADAVRLPSSTTTRIPTRSSRRPRPARRNRQRRRRGHPARGGRSHIPRTPSPSQHMAQIQSSTGGLVRRRGCDDDGGRGGPAAIAPSSISSTPITVSISTLLLCGVGEGRARSAAERRYAQPASSDASRICIGALAGITGIALVHSEACKGVHRAQTVVGMWRAVRWRGGRAIECGDIDVGLGGVAGAAAAEEGAEDAAGGGGGGGGSRESEVGES